VGEGKADKLNLLLLALGRNWSDYYSKHLGCRYKWFYFTDKSKAIDSYFVFQLRSASWVPTTRGLKAPAESYARTRRIFSIAREMVPYLTADLRPLGTQGREFIEALGVNTKLEANDALRILGDLHQRPISKDTYDVVRRLYRHLRTAVQGDSDLVEAESWSEICSDLKLLAENGSYHHVSKLHIRDDETLYRLFASDIPFVWLPQEEPPSSYFGLMEALGLCRLSKDKVVRRVLVGSELDSAETKRLQERVEDRRAYLRSIVVKALGITTDNTGLLDRFHVRVVDRIQVRYRLKHNNSLTKEEEAVAFYDAVDGMLTVRRGHEQDLIHLAKELADGFGIEAHFETVALVLQNEREWVEEFLRMKNIPILAEYVSEEETEEEAEELLAPSADGTEQVPTGATEELAREGISGEEEEAPEPVAERAAVPAHQGVAEFQRTPAEAEEVQRAHETQAERAPAGATEQKTASTTIERPLTEEQPLVEDERASEDELADIISVAVTELSKEHPEEVDTTGVFKARQHITSIRRPRVVRPRTEVDISSDENVALKEIDGEEAYIRPGLSVPEATKIRNLRRLLRRMVEVMGGNPETVNISVTIRERDGYNQSGQLFFNATRDDSPFRWLVVVARELAYNVSRHHDARHMKVMTELLAKAIARIDEIFPELFQKMLSRDSR